MPLKKQPLNDNEIPIYDEALIYQRGEYWQMRMWLAKEKKYARFSLRTRNRDTAEAKAKKQYHELMAQQLAGKTYFSMTAKQAVDEYLKQRTKDMEAGLIVKGRLGTIKTHLSHPKYRPDIDGLRAVAVLAVVALGQAGRKVLPESFYDAIGPWVVSPGRDLLDS